MKIDIQDTDLLPNEYLSEEIEDKEIDNLEKRRYFNYF